MAGGRLQCAGTSGSLVDVAGNRKGLRPPCHTQHPPGPTASKPRANQGRVPFLDLHSRSAGVNATGCHQLLFPSCGLPTHYFLLGVLTQAALVRMVLTQISGSPQGSFLFFPAARRLEGGTPQRRRQSLKREEFTKSITLFQGPYDVTAKWTMHSKVLETQPGFSVYLEGGAE